ncbi:MAG: hypothetical protein JWO58_1769, partial [Chitinophagaceae bacterium]|nr:hypothetical protein [Chitinophagaceae bacterium]
MIIFDIGLKPLKNGKVIDWLTNNNDKQYRPMKKTRLILLTCFLIALQWSAFAQKSKTDPEHTIYYADATAETNEVSVEIKDAVSRIEFSKLKIKLSNKTTDYIVFKPKESTFKIAGSDFSPSDRMLLLQPSDKGGRVLDVKGNGKNLHVGDYQFLVAGLYKINADAPSTEVPNFKLPASVNDITASNFKIELVKISKETKETVAKFKVTYTGKGYGLVNPNKLGVKIENGQEFANAKSQDALLLAPGESDTFTALFTIPGKVADMQFANMEILWRNTFSESDLQKVDGLTVDMKIDEGKTA